MIRSFRPRLHRYIRTSGCSADEVDEITSDIFGELVALERYLAASSQPWDVLLPIARRICANAKRRSRHEFPTDNVVLDAKGSALVDEPTVQLEIQRLWVRCALEQLPPKQRDAVRAHLLAGQSYAEMAATMHSSEGAARFNVHAGLKRLRRLATELPKISGGF